MNNHDEQTDVPVPDVCRPVKRYVIAGTVAALVLAGAGGTYAYTTHAHAQDVNAYSQAVKAETTAFGTLKEAIDSATPLSEGCAEKVQDPSLCEVLDEALDSAGKLSQRGMDAEKVSDLVSATGEVQANTAQAVEAAKVVEDAGAKVRSSMDEKALAGKVTAYEQVLVQGQANAQQAQQVLDVSAGKVTDDTTRQTLATTLTELNQALGVQVDRSKSAEVEKVTKAITELLAVIVSQIQAVTDSQTAWETTNTQASAQAPASTNTGTRSTLARTPAQTTTPRSGSTTGGKTTGGTSTGGKSSGGKSTGGKSSGGTTGGSTGGRWETSYEEGEDCWVADTQGNAWACP